jgi:hypothetical protein
MEIGQTSQQRVGPYCTVLTPVNVAAQEHCPVPPPPPHPGHIFLTGATWPTDQAMQIHMLSFLNRRMSVCQKKLNQNGLQSTGTGAGTIFILR